MTELTIPDLLTAAADFCIRESTHAGVELYGVTDGKAVGTFIEKKFQAYLEGHFLFEKGSAARGIDLPDPHIRTDIKVTSARQPQSSCPYRDSKQKIYGLGYNLLIFVYDKSDDVSTGKCTLNFVDCSFIEAARTADFTTTYRIREMLEDGAILDDVLGYLIDRNIPGDEMTLHQIAEAIIEAPPVQGYLTISNALQWRLQYGRVLI